MKTEKLLKELSSICYRFKIMEKNTILEKHGYFLETAERIASFKLIKPITLEELKATRGVIQRGYREIKNDNFDGTLVDYICWISTLYLFDFLKKADIKEPKTFYESIRPSLETEIRNLTRLLIKDEKYLSKAFEAVSLPDNQREFVNTFILSESVKLFEIIKEK